MTYPCLMDELTTLNRVLAGASLARYGDGEFNLCKGHDIPCQVHDRTLGMRLRDILRASGECLVGIPNLRSETPKAEFWNKYLTSATPYLSDRIYGSAFVTRPDSAPWIDTDEYWRAVESLWIGQDVTLVRGGTRSLTAADLTGSGKVTEIVAPRVNAWADYHELLDLIGTPTRALLCLGPTATVLAVDLAAKGVHAIDAGHIGMFWRKHRQGEPMVVTEKDKAA